MPSEIKFLQGNEACVEAALAVGCRFFAGYPITPSTEIAEGMARRLPKLGGKFIQMEDEIAGLGAVIGASLGGVKSLTATSGPGFSLKQEHIGYACMAEIPCVIVNVQRGGPSTGLPTLPAQGDVMQARWGTHGDHPAIVLSPTSVKEYFDLTVKAFNLSEKFRIPVILLSDEVTAHMREKVEIPAQVEITKRTMVNFGEGQRFNVTGLVHDDTGFPSGSPEVTDKLLRRLHDKISDGHKEIVGIETIIDLPAGCRTALLSFGSTFRPVKKAAKEAGVGLVKLTTLWPFPEKEIADLAKKVDRIIVVEMNLGQLVLEVERVAGKYCQVERLNKVNGLLFHPDEILAQVKKWL